MAEAHESMNPTIVLKLLSGLQIGAEIPLEDGDYLIGSNDDCDIVLLDESVAERHVLLNKTGNELQLTAQDQAVLIGEQQLASGESAELPADTVIGLGTLFVGLGSPDTDWLNLPRPQRSLAVAQSDDKTAAVNPETSNSEQAPVQSQASAELKPQRSRRLAPWLAAGIVVVLAVALAIFRHDIGAWLSADSMAALEADHTLEDAKAIVADRQMANIDVTEDSRGDIVLRGYSATETDKQRLLNALKQIGIPAVDQIRAEDTLQHTLRETLNRLGAGQLKVDYLGQGAVRLHGFFDTDIVEEELIIMLKQDVPGINRIDSDVRTLADAVADLRGRLNSVGLDSLVTVIADQKNVVASGELESEQVPLWQNVLTAFTAATNGMPALISHVKAEEDALGEVETAPVAVNSVVSEPQYHQPLRLDVRGIIMSGKGLPYALLGNGLRISKGDIVGENYIVEAVEIDGVVVRNGSQKYVYFIGGGS